MSLFNMLLYAVMIYMIFRIVFLSRTGKKSRDLIAAVNTISDEDEFFEKIDEYIGSVNDTQFENKGRVIKLWGDVYHEHFYDFERTMNEVDVEALIVKSKSGSESIEMNEDSFFYLYLAIPNMLVMHENEEYRKELREKLREYDERMENQLVYRLGVECNKLYDGEGDLGEAFYQKILAGDYGDYKYSKQLIGLYKYIANMMLAKIYEDRGMEFDDDMKAMLDEYGQTGVGKRWLKALKMNYVVTPLEALEEDKDEETFDFNEDKDVIDTDAEEVKELPAPAAVIEEAEETVEEVKEAVEEAAEETAAEVKETVQETVESAAETAEEMKDAAQEAAEETAAEIKEAVQKTVEETTEAAEKRAEVTEQTVTDIITGGKDNAE